MRIFLAWTHVLGISEFKNDYAISTSGTTSLKWFFEDQAREMWLLVKRALGYHFSKTLPLL